MHRTMAFVSFVVMSLLLSMTLNSCHLLPGRELIEKRRYRSEYRKVLWKRLHRYLTSNRNKKLQWTDNVNQVSLTVIVMSFFEFNFLPVELEN